MDSITNLPPPSTIYSQPPLFRVVCFHHSASFTKFQFMSTIKSLIKSSWKKINVIPDPRRGGVIANVRRKERNCLIEKFAESVWQMTADWRLQQQLPISILYSLQQHCQLWSSLTTRSRQIKNPIGKQDILAMYKADWPHTSILFLHFILKCVYKVSILSEIAVELWKEFLTTPINHK